ncbi:hypothetical protein NQ318_015460 [Aromia moschata]|uniref:Uncharacterized protein n=1 Tax=Aromia moschata TaxID=1265417 RepID=A0AAV8XFI6_9CUCU|nr:hypothetical protein NQ318_015460 [Aromia moschata]
MVLDWLLKVFIFAKKHNLQFYQDTKSSKSLINGSAKTTSDSTNEGLADHNISRDIKKITKALAGIKYDITDMKNNISDIKIKLDMLENKSKSFKSTSDFRLPLTTPQQLLELENKIENATDLEDLVNILSHQKIKVYKAVLEAVKVNFFDADFEDYVVLVFLWQQLETGTVEDSLELKSQTKMNNVCIYA